MKLIFKKIKWKNFLSFGNYDTELSLDDFNATLIRGKNGSGKSSIIEVIVFALFNKPFRDINKNDLINDGTNKQCLVEIEFSIGAKEYRVVRGIKPNIFDVYEDGVLQNQNSDAREYQEILERQILKCNYKSFCQVVILGSASYVPFMKLPLPKRREIIEDLLDLNIFSSMTSILKSKVSDIDSQVKDVSFEKEKLEQKISLLELSMKELRQNNDEVINEYESAKQEVLFNIEKSKKKLDELGSIPVDKSIDKILVDKTSKLNDINKLLIKGNHKIELLNKEIDFLTHNETCPTCKQVIEENFKNKMVAEKGTTKKDIEKTIESIQSKINDLTNEKNALLLKVEEIKNLDREIQFEVISLNRLENQIQDIDLKIDKLKKKNEVYDKSEIEKISQQLAQIRQQEDDLVKSRVHHRTALSMLPLMKSYIIKKFVPVFNEQIRFYLNRFDFPIKFEIDENFEESIQIRGVDGKGYSSLSEGQKYRVNTALLFAWRAVAKLRNSVNTNLLVLDEIMDSSLDYEGKQQFMDIISQFSDGTNIFVISHASDDVEGFDRNIEVQLRGNFSQMRII
jgi:DNA repair exonuclease SbcCD ATPase subunit